MWGEVKLKRFQRGDDRGLGVAIDGAECTVWTRVEAEGGGRCPAVG